MFVHAKCNTPSKLFELAQMFINSLPAGSVKDFEDIYSFVYKNGRDLSGFIDGKDYMRRETRKPVFWVRHKPNCITAEDG